MGSTDVEDGRVDCEIEDEKRMAGTVCTASVVCCPWFGVRFVLRAWVVCMISG